MTLYCVRTGCRRQCRSPSVPCSPDHVQQPHLPFQSPCVSTRDLWVVTIVLWNTSPPSTAQDTLATTENLTPDCSRQQPIGQIRFGVCLHDAINIVMSQGPFQRRGWVLIIVGGICCLLPEHFPKQYRPFKSTRWHGWTLLEWTPCPLFPTNCCP